MCKIGSSSDLLKKNFASAGEILLLCWQILTMSFQTEEEEKKHSFLISLAKMGTFCSVEKTGKSCDINKSTHITAPSTAAHTQTSHTHQTRA